ncbi:MAG: patatin-like phospholipase family protein, partial [Opitutaceae bacterium]
MSDPAPSARPETSAVSVAPSDTWLIAYPLELREKESELAAGRRELLGIQKMDTPRSETGAVGLALSGGGIRSATFALGVLQAMARRRLLGRVDYLSTVSGGGYIGSFWAAWLARNAPAPGSDNPDPAAVRASFENAQRALGDSTSHELRWLRNNGRYLSPNGAGDLLTGFAVHLRNWISIHVVMGSLLLALFLVLGLVSAFVGGLPWIEGFVSRFNAPGIGSLWFVIGVLPAAAALVFFGCIYWLPFLNARSTYRNSVSRALTTTLVVTFGMLVLAGTDWLGRVMCEWLSYQPGRKIATFLATAGPAASVVIAGAKQILSVLGDKTGASRLSIPSGLLAGAVALLLAAFTLVVWSTAAHAITRAGWLKDSQFLQLAVCVLALAVAFAFGRGYSFVNFSSLATIYAARLSRAYLGGTNPERREQNNFRVTETVRGDDIPLSDYNPHKAGGPLHFVNVTLNETIKENARIEHRDSKGVPVAVGPAGISLGVRHHAVWEPHDNQARGAIRATGATPGEFHCFAENFSEGVPAVAKSEALTLGNWISISGAAFTTGLGTRTSAGLSFLLGFFNVRLGYWWNCGVNPARRPGSHAAGVRSVIARLFYLVFPTQRLLLDEM